MTALVENAGTASNIDPNLVNGWGVAFNPTGFVWVAANHTGKSTLYDGTGKPQSLVVTIPGHDPDPGEPTGIVYNGSNDFSVTKGTKTAAARFIFSAEDGIISGWAPSVDGTNAIVAVDNSDKGAVYKGIALAGNGFENYIYATDFHNGNVDVFDGAFKPVVRRIAMFEDPTMPSDYHPFGIQNIQGDIYVTFAKKGPDSDDELHGSGFGYVSMFSPNGNFIRRVASQGPLNAPWGMALAPGNFGTYSNTLLIGNFGDGYISAFDARTNEFMDQLLDPNGNELIVEGLWGMQFGNGIQSQPTNVLYFAAGPNDENDGMYGSIQPVTV
jgi:uncharacterized protein (TIGR03118 family)